MATQNDSTTTPSTRAAGPETPPATLTPDEALQLLRTVRDRMPLPRADLGAVSRKRRISHVNAAFVEAAVSALGNSGGVQQLLGRTDEELRQEIDTASRWTAVADELRALLHTLVSANTLRRQRIGLAALQTYKICQQLARDDQNDHLNAHIREMRRSNKFGRARRKAPLPGEQLPVAKQPA